jgi:hypothetical protein
LETKEGKGMKFPKKHLIKMASAQLLAATLCVFAALPHVAQAQASTADILGLVTDATRATSGTPFGTIAATNAAETPRQWQFALKLTFSPAELCLHLYAGPAFEPALTL